MKVEIKNEYLTGNFAIVGGSSDWLEVDSLNLPLYEKIKMQSYKLIDGKLEFDNEKYQTLLHQKNIDLQISTKEDEISNLKKEIEETDYQIIKNYEYSLSGKELPYKMEALHSQRQAIRDKINIIETQIKELLEKR